MKPPIKCTCHVHQAEDYSKHSRNVKLNRDVRHDCLERARRCRERMLSEHNPEERAWLESVAICAEWTAWTCLLIIREAKPTRLQLLKQAHRPGRALDHLDGDPTNNDLSNLRVVTLKENRL